MDNIFTPHKNLTQFKLSEENTTPHAIIKTNKGDIKVVLFSDHAPKTVENFVTHAKNGYYDGLIFHRIIKNFMIQGGDPTGTGAGGKSIWGSPFEDETTTQLRHFYGALSMANAGPNTNGSQFFIVEKTDLQSNIDSATEEISAAYNDLGGTPHLDGGHTVFGQVYQGMDIVEKISNVEVNHMDKPLVDVVINTIEII